jgi:hypothetical protein
MLRVLSLGAGVQSTTMALMAAHGEFDVLPDCAIFADTQSEPKAVYDHLKWLMSDNVLPFPVHIVTRGNLGEQVLANVRGEQRVGKRDTIPAFTTGKDGGAAPLARHCTNDFKIAPIEKKVREMLGLPKGYRHQGPPLVEQWIGISTDEASRMKPNPKRWAENRWPLIEKRINRNDCLRWMERNGYPTPPKSACTFCPYHNNTMWRDMRDNAPDDWLRAVKFDADIRGGFEGGNGEVFLHRSMAPLSQVDLTTAEDHGQINMFDNDCEGICGV